MKEENINLIIEKMFEKNSEIVMLMLSHNNEPVSTNILIKEEVNSKSFADLFNSQDENQKLFLDLEIIFKEHGSFALDLEEYTLDVSIYTKESWNEE